MQGIPREISAAQYTDGPLYNLILIGVITHCAWAAGKSPQTDWFEEARIGAFMHCVPGNAEQLGKVNDFDVEA
jgi:hypothetical protein